MPQLCLGKKGDWMTDSLIVKVGEPAVPVIDEVLRRITRELTEDIGLDHAKRMQHEKRISVLVGILGKIGGDEAKNVIGEIVKWVEAYRAAPADRFTPDEIRRIGESADMTCAACEKAFERMARKENEGLKPASDIVAAASRGGRHLKTNWAAQVHGAKKKIN